MCRNYTSEEIGRLKEAGVRRVEVHNEQGSANAAKTLAEAAELHAKADAVRQEAALKRIEGLGRLANAKADLDRAAAARAKAEADRVRAVADAIERVKAAIGAIRQKGGQVAFDEQQLLALFAQGRAEFPDDKMLEQLDDELSAPADAEDDSAVA